MNDIPSSNKCMQKWREKEKKEKKEKKNWTGNKMNHLGHKQ